MKRSLEVTQEELAIIEAALHTQKKILHVQASGGVRTARERLGEIKKLLANVASHKPTEPVPCTRKSATWLGMSRIFG